MGHPKELERQVALVSLEHVHGQGNNNKRDDRPGPGEFGLRNPTACIRACRDQFIRARSGETGDDYRDICRILSRSGPNEDLWELYTCDSTFCGVANCAVDQDPNVDLIINVCREYNYNSIFDPGPPPSPKPEICANEVKVNPDPGQSDQRGRPSKTAEVSVEGIKTLTLQDDPASTAFSSTSSSSATPRPPTPDGNSTSTAPDIVKAEAAQSSTGLAAGSKAAIGTCASIALVVIILLALFVMRRRRKDPKGYLRAVSRSPNHHSRSFSQPPSGAHTPLITPSPSAAAVSRTAPSTPPPARLSDRKFLSLIPTLSGGGDRTAPSSPSSVYPSSEYLEVPPASPTHASPPPSYYNRLFPRYSNNSHHQNPHHHKHRRHTPVGTADLNSPLQPPRPVVTSLLARDSAGSLGSYPAATGAPSALMLSGGAGSYKANSVDSGTATVTGTGTPPLSPTWAGHDMSPDVAVAAPAGPPPNRALPPTPPPHHNHHHHQQQQYYHPLPSPTSTLSVPVSPRSPTFPHPHSPPQHQQRPVVLGSSGGGPVPISSSEKVHHYHEAIGMALPGSPTAGGISGSREDLSARDLCELTELYARETRESWGSWSGTGGGGPGVGGVGGARKRSSGNNSLMRCSGDRKASGSGSAGEQWETAVALRDLDLEKLGGSY
ncbi:hypothetical protein DL769_001287 [Monosporascus sp. CRB-8-3]|nr:hypothetical protein DL769_001287 [Monosporascus sp. CRB-8-3]